MLMLGLLLRLGRLLVRHISKAVACRRCLNITVKPRLASRNGRRRRWHKRIVCICGVETIRGRGQSVGIDTTIIAISTSGCSTKRGINVITISNGRTKQIVASVGNGLFGRERRMKLGLGRRYWTRKR